MTLRFATPRGDSIKGMNDSSPLKHSICFPQLSWPWNRVPATVASRSKVGRCQPFCYYLKGENAKAEEGEQTRTEVGRGSAGDDSVHPTEGSAFIRANVLVHCHPASCIGLFSYLFLWRIRWEEIHPAFSMDIWLRIVHSRNSGVWAEAGFMYMWTFFSFFFLSYLFFLFVCLAGLVESGTFLE